VRVAAPLPGDTDGVTWRGPTPGGAQASVRGGRRGPSRKGGPHRTGARRQRRSVGQQRQRGAAFAHLQGRLAERVGRGMGLRLDRVVEVDAAVVVVMVVAHIEPVQQRMAEPGLGPAGGWRGLGERERLPQQRRQRQPKNHDAPHHGRRLCSAKASSAGWGPQ